MMKQMKNNCHSMMMMVMSNDGIVVVFDDGIMPSNIFRKYSGQSTLKASELEPCPV